MSVAGLAEAGASGVQPDLGSWCELPAITAPLHTQQRSAQALADRSVRDQT